MRRLFTPRWILIHLLVVVLVVVMVNLAFWQLRRLDQKRDFNSRLTAAASVPVTDLARTPMSSIGGTTEEWRRVVAKGTYDAAHAVTIVNRSQDGTAGYDTLVPLILADGRALFVNRGFVPLATPIPSPPTGTVEVLGYIRSSQRRGTFGAVDNTDPSTKEFQRFDIDLIARRLSGDHYPWFLQRITESPKPSSQWPAAVALPELTEGPHLSYAIQWFFFSSVAIGAWVVVVGRRLREPLSEPTSQSDTSA